MALIPLVLPERKQVTLDEIQKFIKEAGLYPEPGTPLPERPEIDLRDLMEKPRAPVDLPIDLRPLAGLADTLYGTRMAQNAPNLRREALEEEKMRRELEEPSNAVRQVEAQARLAQFKQQLDQYNAATGAQSPLDKAKTISEVAQILGGGGPGGGSADYWRALNFQADSAERDRKARLENIRSAGELTKEMGKEKAITNFPQVIDKAKRIRQALLYPNLTGVPEYNVIIDYIKALDPNSTVMFNEARSLAQSQGFLNAYSSMRAIADRFEGKNLSPQAKRDMIRQIANFEELARKEVGRVKDDYTDRAITQGWKPEDVTGPIMKRTQVSDDVYHFRTPPSEKFPKGQIFPVPESRLNEFLDDPAYQGAVAVRPGTPTKKEK